MFISFLNTTFFLHILIETEFKKIKSTRTQNNLKK